jgi:amidase
LVGRITSRTDAWFGDVDILLTPTVGVSVPRVGAFSGLTPREAYDAAAEIAAFTAVFNVAGQPAISLPAGFSSSGVPFGVQLVGRRGHDATLLKLAAEVEAALQFEKERLPRAARAPWYVEPSDSDAA